MCLALQILDEEVEASMKEAAVISMGTEVSEHDMVNIKALCDQVSEVGACRQQDCVITCVTSYRFDVSCFVFPHTQLIFLAIARH